MLVPAAAAQGFDQSLDGLVRQRVITSQERKLLRGGGAAVPIERSRFEEACRTGALSRQDCASGVARRPPGAPGSLDPLPPTASARVRLIPSRQPLRVPVSALLAPSMAAPFGWNPSLRSRPVRCQLLAMATVNCSSRWLETLLKAVGLVGVCIRSWGSWLMHAGRDFAAPEGTPVVAALSGQVLSSGLAGGYGVAIELEHAEPLRRTLYGHLSEIYVRPGQPVRQGEVIGRVGSTGLSTGPHLAHTIAGRLAGR